jgi:hypothetical protein
MFEDLPIADLVDRFPRLFRGRLPLCHSFLPEGWIALTTRLLEDIDAMLDDGTAPGFDVLQIKEKFGSLRLYWRLRYWLRSDAPALFDQIAARAEAARTESLSTCACCGAGGASLDRSLGLTTLCEPCCNGSNLDATSRSRPPALYARQLEAGDIEDERRS